MTDSSRPPSEVDRRKFLKTAIATGFSFTIVPRHVLGGVGYTPPSEVVTRAVIGTGGMGMSHVVSNRDGQPPVTLAVCDVDSKHLARGLAKAGAGCKPYSDWREVLERTDIDSIHIATPPHWHATMGIAAAQSGFDLLTEKPFTRTIGEGIAYRDTVARYGRVLQINTHFRFGNYYGYGATKVLKKLVDSNLLGRPLTARIGRPQGMDWKIRMWSGRTNLEPQPIPSELDYDMWLGPAPKKPYHPHRVHASFRGYWDYDGGGLADMGQHYLDPVQYLLDKDDTGPVKITAKAPWPVHPDAVGLWEDVTLEYADGDRIVLESGEFGASPSPNAPFLEGPRGKLYRNYKTDPEGLIDQIKGLPGPEPLVTFEEAVRTRGKTGGNESVSHRSCSLVNLANIAIRTGRSIQWDPEKERIVGDEVAQQMVAPPARAPWGIR